MKSRSEKYEEVEFEADVVGHTVLVIARVSQASDIVVLVELRLGMEGVRIDLETLIEKHPRVYLDVCQRARDVADELWGDAA